MAQIHIRDIPDTIHAALATQAEAEGVSLTEWIRSTLESRARVLSPNQLAAFAAANRAAGRAQTWEEFDATMKRIAHRRARGSAA